MIKNRSNSSKNLELGNTVKAQDSPRYRYCFTLNNYTEIEIEDIKKFCSNSSKGWIIGKEVGESGTPHLQGYINLNQKMRITQLKKINGFEKAHFEECKGSEQQNINYCSKDGNFITSFKIPIKLKIIDQLYKWQEDAENLLTSEKSDRSVHWICDEIGGQGKTQFLKYMVNKYKCIFTCGGKRNDIINLIYNNKDYMLCSDPAIIIWNLPRDINPEYISYEAIEMIKDGCISNNKFECGSFICNSPAIIIMGNQLPLLNKLTADRWNILSIVNKQLIRHDSLL